MKIKFKNYLLEYRKVPLGTSFNIDELRTFLLDEDNIELLRTHVAVPGIKDLVIFEYTFGIDDKVFILTNRQDHKDIAGYMFLHKLKNNIWQTRDTTIFDDYRNKGLGTDLYVKICQSGYNLINGYSLSAEAESLWKKLPKFLNVKTINIETMEIEDYSDKPTKDTNIDDKQIYYWIATSKLTRLEGLNENALTSVVCDIYYELWLKNDKDYKKFGFRSSKYGEEGEF